MAIMFILLLVVLCVVQVASDDFDMTSFKTNVIDDERVWLVEFYSTMCGSCKEFSGVWSKIEASMKSIETTKINIDHPDGMEVAKALRVLDEGVPNVRLLNSRTNSNGVTVMSGDSLQYTELMEKIKNEITGFQRREDGYFVKSD